VSLSRLSNNLMPSRPRKGPSLGADRFCAGGFNPVGNLGMPRDYASDLGSARVSRVGERVLANTCRMNALGRVDDAFRRGRRKRAREARALPRDNCNLPS
jgi:hypothetical protein